MNPDPHPEFRCRCVHRAWSEDHGSYARDFIDRCVHRPTQEDGKCDHCRQPLGACIECDGHYQTSCCCRADSNRHFVDLAEPCMDIARADEVVF